MKSVKTKRSTLILLFLLFISIAVAATVYLTQRPQEIRQKAAPATTLSFSESTKTVIKGVPFTTNAIINTGVNTVAGVELHVTYEPQYLQLDSITLPTTNPLLPNLMSSNIDPATGRATIIMLSDVQGSNGGKVTGTGAIATLTFTPLTTTNTSLVSFDQLTTKIAGASGEDLGKQVLQSTTNLTVTVTDPSPTPTPVSSTAPNPTPTPRPTSSPSLTPLPLPITKVNIHPGIVNTTVGQQIGMSALAYNGTQALFSGVTYEWGISSSGSIGTLSPNGNIATFKALHSGTGDIWVQATNSAGSLTNSVPVTVIQPSPTPTPTPIPVVVNLKFAFQSVDKNPNRVIQVGLTVEQNNIGAGNPGLRAVFTNIEPVQFTASNGETFTQNVAMFKLQEDLLNLNPGVPTKFTLKGPMHLSKSVTQVLNSGNNIVDFTATQPPTLLVGDIDQSTSGVNKIDIFDFNKFVEEFGKTNSIADLNMDGEVSIMDYPYIPFNFGKSGN